MLHENLQISDKSILMPVSHFITLYCKMNSLNFSAINSTFEIRAIRVSSRHRKIFEELFRENSITRLLIHPEKLRILRIFPRFPAGRSRNYERGLRNDPLPIKIGLAALSKFPSLFPICRASSFTAIILTLFSSKIHSGSSASANYQRKV